MASDNLNYYELLKKLGKVPKIGRLLFINDLKAFQKGKTKFIFFCNYFLGIKFNDFQLRVARTIINSETGEINYKNLVTAGNRSGKTVLLACLHIWFAFYKIGQEPGKGWDVFKYRTFNLSPVSRQAKEAIRYINEILTSSFTWTEEVDGKEKRFKNECILGRYFFGKLGFLESINHNMGEVRYANGSMTYCLSTGEDQGASFQGLSCGLLTYDEAVQSLHLKEELPARIFSRLADYGQCLILIATPDERSRSQQYYYHLYKKAKKEEDGWKQVGGGYEENIFIPKKQKKKFIEEMMSLNPEMAAQVLRGEFVTMGGRMFDNVLIERLWNGKITPTDVKPDHKYLISVDWGTADSGDETVMLIFDYTTQPFEIVNSYAKQGGNPWDLISQLTFMQMHYNSAKVILDTNSLGGNVFKKMCANLRPRPISFTSNNTGEKQNALTYTKLLLSKGRKISIIEDIEVDQNLDFGLLRSYYLTRLEDQLATYAEDDSKLETDWVSSLWMGCWYLYKRNIKSKKDKSDEISFSALAKPNLPESNYVYS